MTSRTYLATYEYEAITSRVMDFSIRRGRQHELDRIETGTATMTLLNQDGAFTPSNTSSVYYPDIRPMVPIKIQATFIVPPSAITGLVAWYDFSDISTLWQDTARTSAITADGQAIKGVTDKSSSGYHLSEATNGPAYKVNIQNGKSIARFDGTNDVLAVAGLSAPSAWTCFIVFVKRGALSASGDTLISLRNDSKGQLFADTDDHATGMNWYENQAGATSANVATGPLTWGTKAIRANTTASLDVFTGGGAPTNIDPSNGIFTAQVTLGLGAENIGAANFGDYDIGEFLLYHIGLSAADMNLLGDYLAEKWNVPWTAVS